MLLFDTLTLACPTCAKAFQESHGNAAGWAIFTLLCIILPIISFIVVCFIKIAMRQKKHATNEFDDPFLATQN